MNNPTKKDIEVSKQLPALGQLIEDELTKLRGEKTGFFLCIFTDERAQYISNVQRSIVIGQILDLLDHWTNGQPDIPAHEMN